MIFVTGDTHAQFHRFNMGNFPEQKEMTKDDVVIICGDFGGIWYNDPKNRTETYWLNWLENKPFTVCFCDGNHENFDRLNAFPITQQFGAPVHQIRSNIFHLIRGNVYTIQDKKFFVFGGAHSHDIHDGILEQDDPRIKAWNKDPYKFFRINHVSWWKEEVPSESEMKYAETQLEKHHHMVDFIITHTPPSEVLFHMEYSSDDISNFLQDIAQTTRYTRWFCGHMHDNRYFPTCNTQLLYDGIIRVV